MEFAIDPAKFKDAFATDLPADQTALMAATQRPIAEAALVRQLRRSQQSAQLHGPLPPD